MMSGSLDEPVHLVSHSEEWASLFEAEQRRIGSAAREHIIGIEHIGSTAVRAISSKPIVDILIGVSSIPPAAGLIGTLVSLGYESLGEAGIPMRWYFRKRTEQAYNVHVVKHGSPLWTSNILFRNYLQANSGAAHHYEKAKLDAIAQGHASLHEYSRAKAAVISELLAAAEREGRGE